MSFLNLGLKDSDVHNVSDLSFGPLDLSPRSSGQGQQKNNMNGGGSFSLFNFFPSKQTTNPDKALLEAAKLGKIDVLNYAIYNNYYKSLGAQDDDGNTILHYLVSMSEPNIELIRTVTKNAGSFINTQNKAGDTPLILAVKYGHHDLCGKLIENGADKTIKNKDGLHVDTETDMPSENVTVKQFTPQAQAVDNIINKLFVRQQKDMPVTSDTSIKMGDNETISANDLMKTLSDKIKHINTDTEFKPNPNVQTPVNNTNIDTDKLILGINNYLGKKQAGGSNNGDDDPKMTEELISRLTKKINADGGCGCAQTGGKQSKNRKKNIKKGTRKLHRSVIQTSEEAERGEELGRIIGNQTGKIIEDIVSEIKSIIKNNAKEFKKLGIDTDEIDNYALAYKAALWSSVKSTADKMSAFDVATKIKGELTKEKLLTINDVTEWKQKLEKHYAEKAAKQKQEQSINFTSTSSPNPSQKKKQSKDTSSSISDTSKKSISSTDNVMSQTSYV